MYLHKTNVLIRKMFPRFVWKQDTTEKVIYLTFDDGPTPEITNWTLNVLKQYNAKATFFCIGNNIEKHPKIFQDILNDDHAIGNHTHDHIKGWKTKTADYLKDITKTQAVILNQMHESNSGARNDVSLKLFRPPYGQITPKQGKKLIALGYKIIMWDVLSFDWSKTVKQENCLNNVLTKTTSGSIIVFHDSVKASKNMQYTLPQVLEHFSKNGYVFKALNDAF